MAAVTIRSIDLDSNYFGINASNLERLNLFNQATNIINIDPSVVNPTDAVPDATIDSLTDVVTSDLVTTAVNQLDSAWTTGGWDITTNGAIEKQVRGWILRNLNDSSHFAVMAGKELELHTVWMRGNVSGQEYTVCFVYSGNAGPILANPLQNNDISDYTITEINGGTVTFDTGCLTHTTSGTGGSAAIASQTFDTDIGSRYEFEFRIDSISGNGLFMEAIDSDPSIISQDTFTTVGTHRLEYIATTATTTIRWQPNAISTVIEVCPIAMVNVFGPYMLNEDQSILLTEDLNNVLDSFTATTADQVFNYTNTSSAFGYSFIPSEGQLTSASIRMFKDATPVGNLYMDIYDGDPSGAGNIIGVSDNVDVATIGTSAEQVVFPFSAIVPVTNQTYHAVVRLDSLTTIDATNRINHATRGSENMTNGSVYTSVNFPSVWSEQANNSTTYSIAEVVTSQDLILE